MLVEGRRNRMLVGGGGGANRLLLERKGQTFCQ